MDRLKIVHAPKSYHGEQSNMNLQHLSSLRDRASRLPCLSGNQLKLIAAACMLVDHFSKTTLIQAFDALHKAGRIPLEAVSQLFLVLKTVLYPIGAVAFPLFCYLFVEGYLHTASKKKYFLRLALFALITELPFDLLFFPGFAKMDGTYPFFWPYQNVMVTFLLAMCALFLIERAEQVSRRWLSWLLQAVVALGMCSLAEFVIHCDYEGYGIFLAILFYVLRKRRIYQVLGALAAMLIVYNPHPVSMVVSMVLVLLYNGQRGKRNLKYFFYWFYPAHMVGLLILNALLGI